MGLSIREGSQTSKGVWFAGKVQVAILQLLINRDPLVISEYNIKGTASSRGTEAHWEGQDSLGFVGVIITMLAGGTEIAEIFSLTYVSQTRAQGPMGVRP